MCVSLGDYWDSACRVFEGGHCMSKDLFSFCRLICLWLVSLVSSALPSPFLRATNHLKCLSITWEWGEEAGVSLNIQVLGSKNGAREQLSCPIAKLTPGGKSLDAAAFIPLHPMPICIVFPFGTEKRLMITHPHMDGSIFILPNEKTHSFIPCKLSHSMQFT